MLYVFSVLIGVTLLLSAFSVDEMDAALGGLLADGGVLYLAVVLVLLVGLVWVWRKQRAGARRKQPPPPGGQP